MSKKSSLIFKYFLISTIFILIFFVRFRMLQKSPFFNGLDGYFYGLQAESFAQTGLLENPDLETGYYICGILSFIFQNSILGVKIWASLSYSLFCLLVFSLVYQIVNNKKFLYAFSSMIICAGLFFTTAFSINYINNLTGLIFLLFYVQIFIKIFHSKKINVFYIILLLILFVLCFLSHKVSFLYVLIFSTLSIFSRFSKVLQNKKILVCAIFAIVVFLIAVLVVFVKQRSRFANTFGLPSLPIFHKEFITALGSKGAYCAIEITTIFLVAWFVFFIQLFVSKKISFETILFVILFFPFWNLKTDMGYRMMLNGTVLGIPLIIYFFSKLLKNIRPIYVKSVFCCISFASFISLLFSPISYDPKIDPPYGYYKELVKNIELPDDSLLIAHLGLNHVYTYYKNFRDCMNWLPDYEIDDDKVWRLAFGVDADYIKTFFYDISEEILSQSLLPIDSNYVLIKEQLWNLYLKREDSVISETYKNWFNPYEVRPSYVRDN